MIRMISAIAILLTSILLLACSPGKKSENRAISANENAKNIDYPEDINPVWPMQVTITDVGMIFDTTQGQEEVKKYYKADKLYLSQFVVTAESFQGGEFVEMGWNIRNELEDSCKVTLPGIVKYGDILNSCLSILDNEKFNPQLNYQLKIGGYTDQGIHFLFHPKIKDLRSKKTHNQNQGLLASNGSHLNSISPDLPERPLVVNATITDKGISLNLSKAISLLKKYLPNENFIIYSIKINAIDSTDTGNKINWIVINKNPKICLANIPEVIEYGVRLMPCLSVINNSPYIPEKLYSIEMYGRPKNSDLFAQFYFHIEDKRSTPDIVAKQKNININSIYMNY